MRWQGSASGSTNPLQVTVTGEMNVVAVFEKEYDPSYVNVSGYIEIQGKGNGTYFIPTNALAPNIYLAKPNTTTNDIFYLQGLPGEIKSGNKVEFNAFKMDLNSEYIWIQVHIMLSEISNFSITSGEIVIIDKDTGKNIPVKSTFYSTGVLGAFACTIDILKENPLMYETLRDNNVQNMEVRVIFKE